jgi:mRNA interferase MazF
VVRGEVFRIGGGQRARGHEQRGVRFGVVVQADELLGLSTVLMAPTSASAAAARFRPVIELAGVETRVLVEQTSVVDARRLGESAGRLDHSELGAVDDALRMVLGLA